MNNNNITDSNVATGNHINGDLKQNNVRGNQTNIGGNQNNVRGNQTNIGGNQNNNTKNIGVLGVLGTLILIAILTIITFYFLGIDKKDIWSIFESNSGLSDQQKILMSIRGTYLDEENNELVFSPKSVSGMDGSISMNGKVVSYYKLISENSIYIGAQFSRDRSGIPFTLNGSQLELFAGEGDETRIFTKISDSY
ncbi:hypothetical protein [Herpetosiphon sp. NSE202]|uniref:hypothetical protein n=1 Tax=Herpetosiphon sp. NSE202 TaxID=3351349 RepID=UPI00363661C1